MADDRPIEEQIRLDYHDKVAVITIDRPAVGNALNPPCRDRIRDLFNEFNTSHRARAVILTASGEKLFCPGADLSHTYENDRAEDIPERVIGDPRRMMLDGQYTLFPALLDCDVPVIAAVNGTAAGMGAHLALACDLVICADNAKFVEVFARRGLVPDALGPWLLPRIIGVRRTMELMLFAEDVPACQGAGVGARQQGRPPGRPHGRGDGVGATSRCRTGAVVRLHEVARQPEPRHRPAHDDGERVIGRRAQHLHGRLRGGRRELP
ncbi:MAG: enoyl-CoA hydratase/isomerase family protein [Acidimicrobiales bacterium]